MFNPRMLELARCARSFTQKELADKSGISQGKLSKVEHGLLVPTDDDLASLTEALDYPLSFFVEPMIPRGFPPYHHRKRKTLPAKTLEVIHASTNIRQLHVKKLVQSATMKSWVNLPRYDVDEVDGDAAHAAQIVREHLGVPRGPVPDMVDILEKAGAIVVACDFQTTKLDAMSQCDEGLPPLVFINSAMPGDRWRFTLAHELGHIVLHSLRPLLDDEEMEQQADEFASEFLMPANEIKPYLVDLSLSKLARLKEIWKVSMQALLMRAKNLRLIAKPEYERLWKQLSRAGYRTREPISIPREEPKALSRLIDFHLNELSYGVLDLSRLLHLRVHEFRRMYLNAGAELRLVSSRTA